MKPRRVVVTLEIETSAQLSELRNAALWSEAWCGQFDAAEPDAVKQVQANVVRPEKKVRG